MTRASQGGTAEVFAEGAAVAPLAGAMSLRSMLTRAMVLLATLAVLVAFALAMLTRRLRAETTDLRSNVGSLRVVAAVEVDLLEHARETDAVARARSADELRQRVREASAFVNGREEAQVLADVRRSVDRYLATAPTDAEHGAALEVAFASTRRLRVVNIAQANDAVAEATRLDALARAIAVTVALLLAVGTAFTLLWLRRSLGPILEVGEAMGRFGRGDREARAPDRGAREIREIALRFNEMASSLARRAQAQQTFLAGVAHDMRTPLHAVKVSAALVPPGAPLPPEARVRSVLAITRRQVERLERLAGDLLDTSSVEAGRFELRFERCDARELAHAAAALFAETSSAHEVRVEVSPRALMVRCDPTRIEQVLNNLVSNAIKYSPAGGEVSVEARGEGDEVVLAVRDRGVGMTDEEQALMFEPFRRVGDRQHEIPGAGLGLFVARRIIEAHGGRITVASAPGQGTMVQVRLPAAAAETLDEASAEPAPA